MITLLVGLAALFVARVDLLGISKYVDKDWLWLIWFIGLSVLGVVIVYLVELGKLVFKRGSLLTDELDLYRRPQTETSKLLFERLIEERKDHAGALEIASKAESELAQLHAQLEQAEKDERAVKDEGEQIRAFERIIQEALK